MYSIFHTSFCGSTLLSVLLSKSIPTLTEPDWTLHCQFLKDKTEISNYLKNNFKENTLIKFPSSLCYLAPIIDNKKVFIYRSLKEHLKKTLYNYKNYSDFFQINSKVLNIIYNNLHPKNKKIDFNNSVLLLQAYFWVDRFLWILDSSNIHFINANDFFLNKENKTKEICDFFKIEYIPIQIDYNVKKANLNRCNFYINENNVIKENKEEFKKEEIDNFNSKELDDIILKIKDEFPSLKQFI